jgi:DHA1 family multidrug resistance protein-like MFS transporter
MARPDPEDSPDAELTGHGADRAEADQDRSRRMIRALTLTVLLQWMGATAIVPMLPEYIRHLGGSDALAGVVMASFFAAGVLSQYPIGRLADRIGRRPVLMAGLVVYAVASFSFLLPIGAPAAVALRAVQGVGAGAATVAALAMVSGSVSVERRGRALAAVYGGELAGMAVGPLVGSVVGVRHMGIMFLTAGLLSLAACFPALRLQERRASDGPTRSDGAALPLRRVRIRPSMIGALICGAALGLTTGVYEICWTLLLVARGASGLEIGISWTLFAVPFVLAAKPSGWLTDHMDRRVLVLAGVGMSTVLCAWYPFIHQVPVLILLGAAEALGFAAAMPAVQSLLTQGSDPSEVGRVQGLFGTGQTACTALAAAAAGAAFAVASWLPFVTVALVCSSGLGLAAVVWRSVPGRVGPIASDRSGPAGRSGRSTGQLPVAGAIGLSSEVQ